MGEVCTKPAVDEREDAFAPSKKADVSTKLKGAEATELTVIPGTEVVIIGVGGEEVPVQQGPLVLLKLGAPKPMLVFFVGDSVEDQKTGFYYPVLKETPVLLTGRVLTVHAGDGDVFGIRLPKDAEEQTIVDLVQMLAKDCALEVQQEPGMADKVAGGIAKGGAKLVSGVEFATEKLAQGIRLGGAGARARIKPRQEVQVSGATKASVASARFVTGGAVVITSNVVDGLMETALILGQEAGKMRKGNDTGPPAPPSAGLKVGKAAGMAGLQVFDALIKGGDRLVQETCDETSATVGHVYGRDAGDVTRDGMNVAMDAKQVYEMVGKRAVAKLATKATLYTAKGMIQGGTGNA